MSDYQIITDATADLSAEWADRIGVAVIPMDVELDGSPYLFGPSGDITGSEFFTAMRQGKLGSTSQISPARYEAAFERYLSQGLDILYICFSSGLSGTIQAARICMEELREKYPMQYSCFTPQWSSFRALKKHFCANNQSIELVKV